MITHRYDLSDAAEAYNKFATQQDDYVKVAEAVGRTRWPRVGVSLPARGHPLTASIANHFSGGD